MKNILRRCLASFAAGVITAGSLCLSAFASAAPVVKEDKLYTLSYNLTGLTPTPITNAKLEVIGMSEFPEIKAKAGDTVLLSTGKCDVNDGTSAFRGWTVDGVQGYLPGNAFKMPASDVVLQPVITASGKDVKVYTLTYDLGKEGAYFTNEMEPRLVNPNMIITLPNNNCNLDGYVQCGWTYDGKEYAVGQNIIMPDCDITVYPSWKKMNKIIYRAGDFDDVVGNTEFAFEKATDAAVDLADATRFTRLGYRIVGWLYADDGQQYFPNAPIKMPDHDAVFTAIWEAEYFTINFSSGPDTVPANQKVSVKAQFNSEYTLSADLFEREGYKIVAYKFNSEIFTVDEPFIVPFAKTGAMTLTAVWEEDSATPAKTNTDVFSIIDARKASSDTNALWKFQLINTNAYVLNAESKMVN